MKFLSKAVFIFFALFFSQPLVAEWKTSGWKAGDTVWFIVQLKEPCSRESVAWKIDGIKSDVAKIIRQRDNLMTYRASNEIRGYSTEKSATEYIESTDKRCKEQNALKEKYENS